MQTLKFIFFPLLISAVLSCNSAQLTYGTDKVSSSAPNVLLIVVDDMGFTDLGAFGSEIETPNLDGLAIQGTRLTNLYSAPTCSPTRAMLLSGVDHHLAGMGTMSEDITSNQVGKPGYEGYLNDRVVPLPALLSESGYYTYMVGKWHLGGIERALPIHNGFSKSFALINAGASHLNDLPMVGPRPPDYFEDGVPATIPDGFYSTEFYAKKMIEFINAKPDDGKPFFGYLAFTAPHWPLQAPPASILKQLGRYNSGYEELYTARLERLKRLGLVTPELANLAKKEFDPAWDSLSDQEQRSEARKMEIYAAMIADIDTSVGKVLDGIAQAGMQDDTVIIFLSDNGPEGNTIDNGWEKLSKWIEVCCDNSYENMGSGDSYLWQGPNWASAVAGPFGRYKGWTHEGGTRVPGFVYFPKAQIKGRIDDTMLSVMDIYPTILELLGIEHPGIKSQRKNIAALQGKSWVASLAGDRDSAEKLNQRVFAWELFGKRAVRQGNWKLISYPPPHGNGEWQLYQLNVDPLENKDLAGDYPQVVTKLAQLWGNYSKENGVVLPDTPIAY